jgi:hypothetical protein
LWRVPPWRADTFLQVHSTISATACHQFRMQMLRLLEQSIKGARVSKFLTSGIEPRTFPED